MLPVVAQKNTAAQTFKHGVIASLLALAIALPAAPALAWGQREQDTLKGVVGTLVVGGLILNSQSHAAKPKPQPVYQQPVYQPPHRETRHYREPQYREPQYREPQYRGNSHHRDAPRYYEPQVSIYSTPAARAFNTYSSAERRLIQRRLAAYGYYRGGVDGSFGPGTYSAVVAYANAARQSRELASTASAYGVYDGLIY